MRSISINFILFLSIGVILAISSLAYDVSTGVIGGLLLLGYVAVMKRLWATSNDLVKSKPCDCEQGLSIQLSAYGMLLGHSIATLLQTDIDFHYGNNNTLAVDSWIMVFAALLTECISWKGRRIKDERDARYSAKSLVWGYTSLGLLLFSFALYLGVTPPSFRVHMSNFLIGNILIAGILVSYCLCIYVRLSAYASDRRYIESLEGCYE